MNGFTGFCFALLFSVTSLALNFDQNVPANLQQQINDDLSFIGTIQGNQASALHQEIFGSVSGAGYMKFFDERIDSVGLSGCGNPNAVACFIATQGLSKMWMTPNYVKFSHPQIARLMVIFHEARHTELKNGSWMHAKCPKKFNDPQGNPYTSIFTGATLAGEPACDKTPRGSYGSSLIMVKNISKFCTSCSEKVKMDASIYADDQVNRIIAAKAKVEIKNDLYGERH